MAKQAQMHLSYPRRISSLEIQGEGWHSYFTCGECREKALKLRTVWRSVWLFNTLVIVRKLNWPYLSTQALKMTLYSWDLQWQCEMPERWECVHCAPGEPRGLLCLWRSWRRAQHYLLTSDKGIFHFPTDENLQGRCTLMLKGWDGGNGLGVNGS